jgi:hypothetical protein
MQTLLAGVIQGSTILKNSILVHSLHCNVLQGFVNLKQLSGFSTGTEFAHVVTMFPCVWGYKMSPKIPF